MSGEPAGGAWRPESHGSGGGWKSAITAAGIIAGAVALVAWLLRERMPPTAPPSESGSESGGEEPPPIAGAPPAAGAFAAVGGASVELLDLWVLGGELRGALVNTGGRALGAVSWTMRLVPGYDAENDFGGDDPPVIEVTGSHDAPIAIGDSAVVTLGEPPGWYLEVRVHPMQLRARYQLVEASGARSESEQSTRLVLFHVRSEEELEEIRRAYAPQQGPGDGHVRGSPPGSA